MIEKINLLIITIGITSYFITMFDFFVKEEQNKKVLDFLEQRDRARIKQEEMENLEKQKMQDFKRQVRESMKGR